MVSQPVSSNEKQIDLNGCVDGIEIGGLGVRRSGGAEYRIPVRQGTFVKIRQADDELLLYYSAVFQEKRCNPSECQSNKVGNAKAVDAELTIHCPDWIDFYSARRVKIFILPSPSRKKN